MSTTSSVTTETTRETDITEPLFGRAHNCYMRLMQQVAERSQCKDWRAMTAEWTVSRYYPQDEGDGPIDCCCGHRNIVHCYTIRNTVTGRSLDPIGSKCIAHFRDPRLVAEAKRCLKEWRDRQKAIEQARLAAERARRSEEENRERMRLERDAQMQRLGDRRLTFGKFAGSSFRDVARKKWYVEYLRREARRQEFEELVRYADLMQKP